MISLLKHFHGVADSAKPKLKDDLDGVDALDTLDTLDASEIGCFLDDLDLRTYIK